MKISSQLIIFEPNHDIRARHRLTNGSQLFLGPLTSIRSVGVGKYGSIQRSLNSQIRVRMNLGAALHVKELRYSTIYKCITKGSDKTMLDSSVLFGKSPPGERVEPLLQYDGA